MPSHIECETLPLVSYGLENGRVLDDEAASRSMHGGADGKVHFVLSRWNEAAARRVLSLQWSFTTTPYSSGRATKLCDTRVARLQALILVPQSLGTVARLQALILVPQSLGTELYVASVCYLCCYGDACNVDSLEFHINYITIAA